MKQDILIRNLQKGLESAYEVLFKTFYKELIMHANKYIYDIEVSKEIIQDLFVNIYEKRHNLRINSSLKSYLYRAVQNRCINYINSLKTREKYIKHIKHAGQVNENSIEKIMQISELETALSSAIDELPPKCRMIFKMSRFEGVSNKEIAESLELSKRTVETQISKALKILREKLKPWMQEVYH